MKHPNCGWYRYTSISNGDKFNSEISGTGWVAENIFKPQ